MSTTKPLYELEKDLSQAVLSILSNADHLIVEAGGPEDFFNKLDEQQREEWKKIEFKSK